MFQEESLSRFEDVIAIAKREDIKVRGYVSCVMGCPYQGEIDPKLVNTVANKLLDMGCYEISLGDTIGIGNTGKTIGLYKNTLQRRHMLCLRH